MQGDTKQKQIRQRPTLPQGNPAVPSALVDLTSEFGMGSGVPPPLWPPKNFDHVVYQGKQHNTFSLTLLKMLNRTAN